METDVKDQALMFVKGTRLAHDGRERKPEVEPDKGESSIFVDKGREDPPKRFK